MNSVKGVTVMKETQTTISCKTLWDDKKQNRYMLSKVWDTSKPTALVISKSAGIDDGVEQTVTQLIITNNLFELGYGGFVLCNLISNINGKTICPHNIKVLEEQIKSKAHKSIILCWGTDDKFSETLKKEIISIIEIFKKEKIKNVLRISDGSTENYCHPLYPKVRNSFFLVPVDL